MSSDAQVMRFIDAVVRLWRAGRLITIRSIRRLHRVMAGALRQREVMRKRRSARRHDEVSGLSSGQWTQQYRRNQSMRILANYGYKANGDMYSVTFETIGDVPATQAPQTVDELFRLAKEAVQRQLAGVKTPVQPATTVTVPQPVATPPAAPANGNGRKPQIKDPSLPATPKQVGLLRRLARQKGRRFDDLTDLTMGEASGKIEELMAL